MTSEETQAPKVPWVQTTGGVIVVNGVVTAVVSSIVTAVINNAGTLPWGSILLTFGIVAVTVFLLLSIIRKRLREAIWARPARWFWSWRPVSARRHARELAAVDTARDALAAKADQALAQVWESLQKVTGEVADQLKDQKQRVDVIMHAVEDHDKELKVLAAPSTSPKPDLDAMARAEAQKPPRVEPIPSAPQPRWRLTHPDMRDDDYADDGKFLLQNLIEGSIAKNVRIENTGVGYFDFEDGAFWADMSGRQSNPFGGTANIADVTGTLKLQLRYEDYLGKERRVYFVLAREGDFRQLSEEEQTLRL